MQPIYTPSPLGKTPFFYGVCFGIIISLVCIPFEFSFPNFIKDMFAAECFTLFNFLMSAAGYLFAGLFAAKKTGTVSTGTMAGLWAGATYGILHSMTFVMAFLFGGPIFGVVFTAQVALIQLCSFLLVGAIGIGAVVGFFGGAWRGNISKVPLPAYPGRGQSALPAQSTYEQYEQPQAAYPEQFRQDTHGNKRVE